MVNSLGYHLSKRNEKKIDRLKYKVIVFVCPEKSRLGVQKNEISFPFSGEIHEVNASCITPGEVDTVISIEKISAELFEDVNASWTTVADTVTIPTSAKSNKDFPANIISKKVDEDDYFRVVVDETGIDMRNIVVEVVIKLDII
jgi:hypothetical protein